LELFTLYIKGGIFITKEFIMKKIIRLTESDLVRLVKRVISEQSPYVPGMGPKTTTPVGVNPTNKPSIKDTDEFATQAEKEVNKKEFTDFIKQQSYAFPKYRRYGDDLFRITFEPYDLVKGTARASNWDMNTMENSMRISKENLPKDIQTNPCYSNFSAHPNGSLEKVDVKMSCKKEYKNLVYLMKKENEYLNSRKK
jgi:hypothetical protein